MRSWWRRFRSLLSFLADLGGAVLAAAAALALIIAAVAGTAVFVLDVMPPALLAMFVVGVAGLAFVGLVLVLRRVPTRRKAVSTGPMQAQSSGRRGFTQDDKVRVATELRDCQHEFTSYLKGRAQEYASLHGVPKLADREPDWDVRYHGDQAWEDATVAHFKYTWRPVLYKLLDKAHEVGVAIEDAMNALRRVDSADDIWAFQRLLFRIELDLRGGKW